MYHYISGFIQAVKPVFPHSTPQLTSSIVLCPISKISKFVQYRFFLLWSSGPFSSLRSQLPYARGLQPSTSKEPFWPLSYRIKFTWSPKIFDAQIKLTRHIPKVLYSVMLQGRGVALISEVRGTELSNVKIIIIINIIVFLHV